MEILYFIPKSSLPYVKGKFQEGFFTFPGLPSEAEVAIFGEDGYGGNWLPIAAVKDSDGWHPLTTLSCQWWEDVEEVALTREECEERYLSLLAERDQRYQRYLAWRQDLHDQAKAYLETHPWPYEGWVGKGEATDDSGSFDSYVDRAWIYVSPEGKRIKSNIKLNDPIEWALAQLGLSYAVFPG